MKKTAYAYRAIFIAVLFAAILFLSACTNNSGSQPNNTKSNDTNAANSTSGKTYIYTNPDQCKVIKFMCTVGKKPFVDDKGCGCEPAQADNSSGPLSNSSNGSTGGPMIPYNGSNSTQGSLTQYNCSQSQREAQVCYEIVQPVCGWFNASKIQCFAYPCAKTYTNDCFACQNPDVAYYTRGTCPSPGIVH